MALKLPKAFALKFDLSYINKYLAYVKEKEEVGNNGLLKFDAEDMSGLTVFEAEAARSGDGLVHLKCSYNNKYWRRRSNDLHWIAAEADEPEEDQGKLSCTLFKVIFNGDSTIKLFHVQLGYCVCASGYPEPYRNCLFAESKDPDENGLDNFSVHELVPVSSEIFDVKFGLEDAKIQSLKTVDLATGDAANNDEHSNEAKAVLLEYTVDKKSTWRGSSSSLNSDLITKIKSAIPVIINGKAELSGDEITGLYQWGKPLETIGDEKTTYNVMVPPSTTVMVTLKATDASAVVPFSYTQQITFANGTELTRSMDDGTFTGVNLFDFKYEAKVLKTQNA